jgi:hypothetical protein
MQFLFEKMRVRKLRRIYVIFVLGNNPYPIFPVTSRLGFAIVDNSDDGRDLTDKNVNPRYFCLNAKWYLATVNCF